MAEDKRIYRFVTNREDAEKAQQREEIRQHVDKLNHAWQEYDRIKDDPYLAPQQAECARQYMEALEWLHAHGLSDMDGPDGSLLPLAYNKATLTYTLPVDM